MVAELEGGQRHLDKKLRLVQVSVLWLSPWAGHLIPGPCLPHRAVVTYRWTEVPSTVVFGKKWFPRGRRLSLSPRPAKAGDPGD